MVNEPAVCSRLEAYHSFTLNTLGSPVKLKFLTAFLLGTLDDSTHVQWCFFQPISLAHEILLLVPKTADFDLMLPLDCIYLQFRTSDLTCMLQAITIWQKTALHP